MAKLTWDQLGERLYETGVKKGVLYPQNPDDGTYPLGVAWNGLTTVTESPSGAESTALYADDAKYLNLISAEQFGCSIEAYTYPDEFAVCDGSAELSTGVVIGQQTRQPFGLSYKTSLGNDLEGVDYGYKLHIVYGCVAAPSEKAYATINDSPEAITFSWTVTTTPVEVTNYKPTATIIIDSTKVNAGKLEDLEDMLYGTVGAAPYLPLPSVVAALFTEATPSAVSYTVDPTDNSTGKNINSNIVITFNNAILEEAIVVTDELGGIVAGSKSWDTAHKILTFNPTADLTADTLYIVTIGGVIDIYNQVLAASVVNFHTT